MDQNNLNRCTIVDKDFLVKIQWGGGSRSYNYYSSVM